LIVLKLKDNPLSSSSSSVVHELLKAWHTVDI
jgi:Ran GTPase-activating protein (RanGAP) involved in mRNA processing and transport